MTSTAHWPNYLCVSGPSRFLILLPCWFVYLTEVIKNYWCLETDKSQERFGEKVTCGYLDIDSLGIFGDFLTEEVVISEHDGLIFVGNFP